MPVETGVGLVAVELEEVRLVKSLRVGKVFPFALAPVFYQSVGHFGDCQMAAVIGAEVPGAGIFLRILPQGGAEQQVTAEGF